MPPSHCPGRPTTGWACSIRRWTPSSPPEPRLAQRVLGHQADRAVTDRKTCGAAEFAERRSQRIGCLMRVIEGRVVGEPRDAELVDIAPYRDVDRSSG